MYRVEQTGNAGARRRRLQHLRLAVREDREPQPLRLELLKPRLHVRERGQRQVRPHQALALLGGQVELQAACRVGEAVLGDLPEILIAVHHAAQQAVLQLFPGHSAASAAPWPGNSCSPSDVTDKTSNSVPHASKTSAFSAGMADVCIADGETARAAALAASTLMNCRRSVSGIEYSFYGAAKGHSPSKHTLLLDDEPHDARLAWPRREGRHERRQHQTFLEHVITPRVIGTSGDTYCAG